MSKIHIVIEDVRDTVNVSFISSRPLPEVETERTDAEILASNIAALLEGLMNGINGTESESQGA